MHAGLLHYALFHLCFGCFTCVLDVFSRIHLHHNFLAFFALFHSHLGYQHVSEKVQKNARKLANAKKTRENCLYFTLHWLKT